MPIEFRCENVSGFDEISLSQTICRQKLRVSSKQAGAVITCPKCRQKINVPYSKSSSARQDGSAEEKQPFLDDPLNLQPISFGDLDQQPNVMEMEFQENGPVQNISKTESVGKRCPQCGGMFVDEGVCGTCRYVEPVQAAERRSARNTPPKVAGFQLWLTQLASEDVSLQLIGYILFALTSLFCFILVVWGILLTSFIGVAMAIAGGFLFTFLLIVFGKTKQIAGDGTASLGPLEPFWNVILFFARRLEWHKYDSRFEGRKVIDRRESPISDPGVGQLPGLNSCEVLDLENSKISDTGLRSLYGLPNLRCLVLKNTEVTSEGISMLQQHQPKLWIWY